MTEIDTGYPGIDEALRAMQRTTSNTRMTLTFVGASIQVHEVDHQKVLVVEVPPNIQIQLPLTFDSVVALRTGLAPEDA